MISFFEAQLQQLSIHHIGNKLQEEYYSLSESALPLEDEALQNILLQYFLKPFEKQHEVYHFYHANADLQLNEVYHFVNEIFKDPNLFHAHSRELAKYLYEVSNHPKIKSGEFYVSYFKEVQIEGELVEAVGIFKSETKDTYLKVYPEKDNFNILYEENGISINKVDKACLILNAEAEAGFKVLVIDQSNRSAEAAVYWKDDFLKLKIRNDHYNQTHQLLGVYKNFVTEQLDQEFEVSKADKIDLLNRSMNYFKEKETFDLEEFSQEVIGNAAGIASFKQYKDDFEQEFDSPIATQFEIADAAVKKQARVYKSVLKLDKNFHIYIHGDKELIEKGFDEEKHMNYYKVYFKEEV